MSNPVQLDRAISTVRTQAEQFMRSTVTVRRHALPVFDINTGQSNSGANTLVYHGKARFWEVTGGGTVIVGEDEISQENTQMSIPWNASGVPIKGDLVKVDADPDANMVGRVFAIQSMAKSGLLRPTRRYSVQMVEERNVS